MTDNIYYRRPTGIKTDPVAVVAASGDATVIAAQGVGKIIRVYRLVVYNTTLANNVTVKRGSTALTGAITLNVGGSLVLDATIEWIPWFTTGPNEAFILNNSAVSALGGCVTYSVEGA